MDKELSHGQNDSHPNRKSDINKRVPQGRDTTRKLTRVIQNESRDPFGGNVYYVTMQITFPTRKFRNGERNFHCDVVHNTTKSLTPDCNGVFAIKAYADDLVLWSTSANMYSAQANVNISLRNLWTYCNLWKLKLNTNKTITNKIVYTIFSMRYKVEKSVKINRARPVSN